MHRRVKSLTRLIGVDSLNDHCIVTHAAADKPALPRKGRRRTFAHDPPIFAIMFLKPGEIVMIMYFIQDFRAKYNANDVPRHCFPPGISIFPGQSHSR